MSDPISSYVTHLECKLKDMKDMNKELERERDEARKQAAMWKSNHDNQVSLKSMLMDRPDLGDRASQIAELIRERDELREHLKSERALADRLEQENADVFLRRWAKAQERAIDAERERDQYKGLLIRLYNDLFVHHKGEAVREFKELFREENYN